VDVPPVFTAEEIARFRSELARQRGGGGYRPGHWSVSPRNRDPRVVGRMPDSIRFRDSTLRSVETMPGVLASDEAKAAYLRELVRAGVAEIVTGGLRGRDDAALAAEVEVIKAENPQCRALCPLVTSPADIDRAQRAGYDAVQVWVQGFGEMSLIYQRIYDAAWRGEQWRTPQTPRSRAEVLARAAGLVAHARERGLAAATPLLMVSYLTGEMLAESVATLVGAGATEITLFDGPGGVAPEAYADLVSATLEHAPGIEVGLHPHNTFGLAVACAVAAARAGAAVIELSVNGYCGGPGNADLAATTMAFEALYGVRTGIHTPRLTPLARAGERLTGYRVAWNHPITGTHAFAWGGMDLITQEVTVDPLLHNCVEPAIVGNRREIPFTVESGPYTLAGALERLGIAVPRERVEPLLERARRRMVRTGRPLTDEELADLARSAD
jgi:2-isopropylmalate synthase